MIRTWASGVSDRSQLAGDGPASDVTIEDGDDTAIAAPAAARRKSASITLQSTADVPTSTPPTQQLPEARAAQLGTEDAATRLTTASTPIAALRIEEVARTHMFLKFALLIIAAIAIALCFMGGDPAARKIVHITLIPAALASVWLLFKTRDVAKYSASDATIVAVVLGISAYSGVFYWGIFSPGPALILLGIYFFSLGASRQATVFVYIFCAGVQAVLAGLIFSGAVVDRGYIRADAMALHEQVITQAIVQVLYLCSFLVARSSRRETLNAVAELERAVRSVSQREALLLEARQDLDLALRVGGPGRYTEQVVGSFTLGVLIGRGGMGEVYEGIRVTDKSRAAIKLLHAHVLANPGHVQRFEREIEVAASLEVANVVKVLEFGRTQGELPYLAMERLQGHDLAYHLRKRRRLSLGKTVEMVRQIGAGLSAARAAGIVHRDIKPQNLFLAELGVGRPVWKILDFGVSKLAEHSGTLTKGHVVGTPGYMAPEQARGKNVDYRADIYALAAISYRALTGRPPFSGKDLPTTLYEVVYSMPLRPSHLAELPADVDIVLAIGMAKDREARFESGEELATALANAGRGELEAATLCRGRAVLAKNPWGEDG